MSATAFVGRERELQELRAAIAKQEGKVVLVIGGEGRGKSALLAELNRQLAVEPFYFPLLYQLNQTDTSLMFFERLMQDLLDIDGLTKWRLVRGVPDQGQRWRALLDAVGDLVSVPLGSMVNPVRSLSQLLKLLIQDDNRPMRERFLHFLRGVASRLEGAKRLVLILDPDKYLAESVEADWRTIAQQAPERITIIFGQRPDDRLAGSEDFLVCRGVCCIPRAKLGDLLQEQSDALVRAHWQQREEWRALAPAPPPELSKVLWKKYKGWPLPLTIALQDMTPRAALRDVLEEAERLPALLNSLLEQRFDRARAASEDAVKVLRGLAVLGRPVSFARIAQLYGGATDEDHLESICSIPDIARCLVPAGKGTVGIFHATMTEYILENMAVETKRKLHHRAAGLYEADLKGNGQDLEALDQWPRHLWEAGEEGEFLNVLSDITATRHRLRLYRSSLRDLERARKVYLGRREAGDREAEAMLAQTLDDLGETQSELGQLREAWEALREAREIRERLARTDRAAHEPGLALTLVNLGGVLHDLGKSEEARQARQEALDIYRRLAQGDEARYRPEVARASAHLGNVLYGLRELEGARRAYEEALEIRKDLAGEDPHPRDPHLASVLVSLGTVLHDLGEVTAAQQRGTSGVEIYRRLAKAEPSAYDPDLAGSLDALGAIWRSVGELEEARLSCEQAVDMFRRLAQSEPTAYEPRLACALSGLAAVRHDRGEFARAEEACGEAVRIARSELGRESQAYEPDLACCLTRHSHMQRDLGQLPAAGTLAREAEDICRRVVARRPARRLDLGRALDVLASVRAAESKPAEARGAWEESLSIFTEAAGAAPAVHVCDLDESACHARRFLESTGQPLSSWPTLQRAREAVAARERADPGLATRLVRMREAHGSVEQNGHGPATGGSRTVGL